MTTTTITTDETTSDADHIVHLDPRCLIEHPANPRVTLGDVSDLAASIREIGVLQPLIVTPLEDGSIGVLAGSRRREAAILAERETVPCIVRSDLSEGLDAVLNSGIENLRRKDLTPVEEGRLYEQLAGFGLSAQAIAKKTGSKQKRVKEHLAVAGSEVAAAAGERFDFLTLGHLLILQEFDDDLDAVRELTLTAKRDPDYFDHRASQFRQERTYRHQLEATTARLTGDGVTIVEDPGWSRPSVMKRLRDLVTDKAKDLNEQNHKSCEGHVASIHAHNPEVVTYWCLDPATYGHSERYPSSARNSSSDRGEDGKLTEEARTERRRVIDNNKAMDAAIPVRREFVKNLIARKAAPKGGLRFSADDLARHPESMTPLDDGLLAAFLGAEGKARVSGRTVGPRAVEQANEARLVHVLLAHSAASIETTWTKEAWRSVDPRKAAWLSFLAAQGYRLAEVEQLVVDEAAAQAEQRRSSLRVVATGDGTTERVDDEVVEDGEGDDTDEHDLDPKAS